MAKLKLSKIKYSKLFSFQRNISKLDLVDIGLGGGFGSIYKSILNGTNYAVKIFHFQSANRGYDTINNLIDQIDVSVKNIDGLKALPLFSFEGKLNSKIVKGYVTYFFDTNSYVSLEDILNSKLREYATLSFDKRFLLVKQLCEALLELEKISFIHADINAQNILIDLQNLHLIIIDFDSGAITSGDNFIPATFGKLNEWVAPEIREQMIVNSKKIRVNIHSDRFSAIVGIHYLLFMQPPYCYIKEMSSTVMQQYLKKYGWSNSPDSTEHYFTHSFPAYSKMVQYLKHHRADFFRALEVSLNQGYFDKNSRVTYSQFLSKIKSSNISNSPKQSISSPKGIFFTPKKQTKLIYTLLFGSMVILGYYLMQSNSQIVNKPIKSKGIVVRESINLHDVYISNHYLLKFTSIEKIDNKLNFSYSLIQTDRFKEEKRRGYIDLDSLKIYFEGLSDIGIIKKDGSSISFMSEIFI